MKNIKIERVNEIKGYIENYKKYIFLHQTTEETLGDDYAAVEILHVITGYINEILEDIRNSLYELYEDWAGISKARKEYREIHGNCGTGFWDIEDEIKEKYEKEGICECIVGIKDILYVDMGFVPVTFIKKFISEYGLFALNSDNDIEIL